MQVIHFNKPAYPGNDILRAKRRRLRELFIAGKWIEIEKECGFKPEFKEMENGFSILDWNSVPKEIKEFLRRKRKSPTQYKKSGGIYDPKEKPKGIKHHVRTKIIPIGMRIERLPLIDRVPLRERLHESQKGICYFCKRFIEKGTATKNWWSLEHLTPLSRGGTNEESNLVGACSECNSNKDCLTESEFLQTEWLKNKIKEC